MSGSDTVRDVTVHTVELRGDGVTIAATVWGAGPGRPDVLLVPGGGQTRHTWRRTALALVTSGRRPMAVDLRGHGDSGWAGDADYSVHAFARDLACLGPHLGDRPALVGASVGGLALLLAAGRAPGLGSALALLDVTPRLAPSGVDEIAAFMRTGMDGFPTLGAAADTLAGHGRPRPALDRLRRTMRHRDGRWHWHWDPRIIEHIHDRPGSPEAAARTRATLDAAARVPIPTLIARGENSTVVTRDAVDELATALPRPYPVDLPGVGHMLAGDDNDPFTEVLIAFLDRHRPVRPATG